MSPSIFVDIPNKIQSQTLDELLERAFTPENIIDALNKYKIRKWDLFSSLEEPTVSIPMGSDGIEIQAFEKQLIRNAKNIARKVTEGKYTFHPFLELDIAKDKSKKLSDSNKRTLGLASIRDTLVQDVLYEYVLYETFESIFQVLDDKEVVSFAYRKGKSAPAAALSIYESISNGYMFAYDADLKKFFDTISHDLLLEKLSNVLDCNSKTYKILFRFIKTDRVENQTYRSVRLRGKYVGKKIFHNTKPKRKIKTPFGVPQGGILSGMLANFYLHEFDNFVVYELMRDYDIKYVRYADDFIVLAKREGDIVSISKLIEEKLQSNKFILKINKEKTKFVDAQKEEINFVGFRFFKSKLSIKLSNIDEFKSDLLSKLRSEIQLFDEEIEYREFIQRIISIINRKVLGFSGYQYCPKCSQKCEKRTRSWISFFKCVNDYDQIKNLDSWIRSQFYKIVHKKFSVRVKRKEIGVSTVKIISLTSQISKVRGLIEMPCLCVAMRPEFDFWAFLSAKFHGKTFKTLSKFKAFHIPKFSSDFIYLSVSGRQYKMDRETILNIWQRLINGEEITRHGLERSGVSNASHIVALMSRIPFVEKRVRPITIKLAKPKKAAFIH